MKPIELKELIQDLLGPLRYAITDESIKQTPNGEMYDLVRQCGDALNECQRKMELFCERKRNA
jgi:hypothetical protein